MVETEKREKRSKLDLSLELSPMEIVLLEAFLGGLPATKEVNPPGDWKFPN